MVSQAVDQNLVNAQYKLGLHYERVRKDMKEAIKWYTLAANQGDVLAQYGLGNCYNERNRLQEDDKEAFNNKEAFKWYTLAANHGIRMLKAN